MLPRRVPGYRPEQLDQLCASGELVWAGAGLDRVAVFFREDAPVLGRPGAAPAPDEEQHAAIRAALENGALFWYDLLAETQLEDATALPALWDLVWAGEVTNDEWAPLRAERRYQAPRPDRRARRFSRARAAQVTATQGRWSLGGAALRRRAGPPRARGAAARAPGHRYARLVRGEGIAGGYGAVYSELRALETLGTCRRGYFVEGLGGAQFALAGAVERLRELRRVRARSRSRSCWRRPTPPSPTERRCRGRSWQGRAARVAGAHVVLLGGVAALYVERGGRTLAPLREPDPEWLRPALAALVAHVSAAARNDSRSSASTASR